MQPDATLARVRQARWAISARCGHDPKRLVEYYIQRQLQHADRLIATSAEAATPAEGERETPPRAD